MSTEALATRERHSRILEQLDRMIELVSDPAKLDHQVPETSAWSVGQQVEHLACVHQSVADVFGKLVRDEGDGSSRLRGSASNHNRSSPPAR